jgi:hypothetical protein
MKKKVNADYKYFQLAYFYLFVPWYAKRDPRGTQC